MTTTAKTQIPSEFKSYLNSKGEAIPTNWKEHPSWEPWRAGFNACAEKANKAILQKYHINETAKRVF